MSRSPVMDPEEARRRLEALRDADVPQPDPAYWSSFPSRVRRAIDAHEARRRAWFAWPAWGAAAATVLVVAVWIGTWSTSPETAAPEATALPSTAAPPTAEADDVATEITEDAEHEIDGTLDTFFGAPDLFDLTADTEALSAEERRLLLESLRVELESSA